MCDHTACRAPAIQLLAAPSNAATHTHNLPPLSPVARFPLLSPSMPMFMFMAQAGPMNFYSMDENSRKTYLDDGLHMTEYGYDTLAGHISGLITASSQATRKH